MARIIIEALCIAEIIIFSIMVIDLEISSKKNKKKGGEENE